MTRRSASKATRRITGWAVTAVALGAPICAHAKADCSDAFVEAQQLMRSSALGKARERLIVCSADDCLAAVKSQCTTWLGEVNGKIPSIVVNARAPDGGSAPDVRVIVDGSRVSPTPEGEFELDPGVRRLRFELDGTQPILRELVLDEGQKRHLIDLRFAWDSAHAGGGTSRRPRATDTDAPPPTPTSSSSVPTATWILGGVAVIAFAGTGYFWLDAESRKSDLSDSGCAPRCDASDVDAVRRQRLIGDVALGVGVVSLGAAALFWILAPKSASKSAALLPRAITF